MNTRFRIKVKLNISLQGIESFYRENDSCTCICYENGMYYSFMTTSEQHEQIEQALHDYFQAQENKEANNDKLDDIKAHLLGMARSNRSLADLQRALYDLSQSI